MNNGSRGAVGRIMVVVDDVVTARFAGIGARVGGRRGAHAALTFRGRA